MQAFLEHSLEHPLLPRAYDFTFSPRTPITMGIGINVNVFYFNWRLRCQ